MEGCIDVGGPGLARHSRRRKTVWQDWQKEALLSAFTKSRYLSFRDRQELARQMGLPESRIRVWFQNRRNRTGEVGQVPKRSPTGSSRLASPQHQEELGSSQEGRGMPSALRRPRTPLTLPQREILLQAFEMNPLPGSATRDALAQRTGLPEDTIHIWFQNRRARHPSRARSTAQDQDLLASGGLDGTPATPGSREQEGAQDSFLPLDQAGGVRMDPSSQNHLPTFSGESQPYQEAEPSAPGQVRAPTQASITDPLDFLHCELLDPVQMQEHAPAPMDRDGASEGREHKFAQDSLLPLDEAGRVLKYISSFTDPLTFRREFQPCQGAQPPGSGQADLSIQVSNTDPLESLLVQLLPQVHVEEHGPDPVNLEDTGLEMDTIPELPLSQEEYQALLDML